MGVGGASRLGMYSARRTDGREIGLAGRRGLCARLGLVVDLPRERAKPVLGGEYGAVEKADVDEPAATSQTSAPAPTPATRPGTATGRRPAGEPAHVCRPVAAAEGQSRRAGSTAKVAQRMTCG